ncbi:hypothetical protein BG015_003670 [Linnemannia schmuckeri]|uniref:Uncharacterized protein n=1 Tax=Linnemannia schmuckeri TaxID=64567 RepID=A0A9P5RK28_9FUNG|nr:hypothetical protein BG015_003670 [Linnemannia schmuckeri]
MAIARPDRTSSFSSQNESPIDDELLSAITSTSISGRHKHGSSSSSSSSTSTDGTTRHNTSEADDGPILSRLLVNRDLFPMIVRHLDTQSLLSLSTINARFRREIFVPLTPNLCCLNLFLQERTVVCPMDQFESLKDFMAKYRCFKPVHLHFTYSDRSSLMSLVPEISAPIYNSKVDNTFSHPSTSPLTSSNLTGVNQSISINITSANSLYQHHHPLIQSPPVRQSLLHTQHENDRPETSSSRSSNSLQAMSTQHATNDRLKTTRTSSSSSTDSSLSDSCDSTGEGRTRRVKASDSTSTEDKVGSSIDIPRAGYAATSSTSTTTTTSAATAATTLGNIASSDTTTYHQQKQHAQEQQHRQSEQQQQQPQYTSRSVDYYSSSSNNPTPINTHHGGALDLHPSSILSDSIPVLSSSSSSTSQQLMGHGQHGFELSYWQKFALNELFMRLLPFLRTLTIGRTDKPTRRARDEELATVNGELSAGVCFFLARCFNVMHDMPDTALESVVWMDVTAKDVVLLITMIELRDIMVDERYWKRGYWVIDRPRVRSTSAPGYIIIDDEDDEGDWDGFYYLINQEGAEKKVSQPKKKSTSLAFSAGVGQTPRRKASTIKDYNTNSTRAAAPSESSTTSSRSPTTIAPTSSSSSSTLPSTFSKQMVAPLPTQQSASGLAQLVKSASSTTTGALTTTSGNLLSSASAIADHTGGICRGIPEPEPWQGFGEDISKSSVPITEELPPAVQLFEALKAEINDVAAAARSSGKGKKPSLMSSGPWRY